MLLGRRASWREATLAAAAVGGLLAFDLQAVIHELGHQHVRVVESSSELCAPDASVTTRLACWVRSAGGWLVRGSTRLLCSRIASNICSLTASSATAVPWFAYYFAGGHAAHHLVSGEVK